MAEVLIEYEQPLSGEDGPSYRVRAIGRPASENLWEGWFEFVPDDDSPVLRSRRETTQPNREDLEYWASGIERVYLEGALERALRPETPPETPRETETPYYATPAPPRSGSRNGRSAALDPFRVYASQGDSLLRQQLNALDDWQLQSVAIAHEMATGAEAERMNRSELIETIMEAVRSP